MEEAIRRTSTSRNASNHKRRSKRIKIYNLRAYRKILIQLSISGLILILILTARGIDKPFAKDVIKSINGYISKNLDWAASYKILSEWSQDSFNYTKNMFKKENTQGEKKPVEGTAEKGASEKQETKTEPSETKNSSFSSVEQEESKKTVLPVFSSMNSMENDIKYIKSKYKIRTPVNGLLSSRFGLRTNPITHKEEFHPGIDIAANMGTPIYSAISGTVIEARKGTSYGLFVKVSNGKGIVTTYAHCSKLFVKSGQKVSQGKKLANVGNTGMSLGAHLHFEIVMNERFVDPIALVKLSK